MTGAIILYNESLGTTSHRYQYDRLKGREAAQVAFVVLGKVLRDTEISAAIEGTRMEAEKKSEVLVESQPTAPDQAVIPFVERRTTPRHSVDVEASILLLKHGSRFNCHLNDLSMTGCRLQSKVAFQCAAFTRVEVNFRLLGLMFRFCSRRAMDRRQAHGWHSLFR